MSILFFMVPAALLLGLLFLVIFIWSARSGQYDDLVTPSIRILNDNTTLTKNSSGEPNEPTN